MDQLGSHVVMVFPFYFCLEVVKLFSKNRGCMIIGINSAIHVFFPRILLTSLLITIHHEIGFCIDLKHKDVQEDSGIEGYFK